MKKKFIVLIIIVVVLAAGAAVYFLIRGSLQNTQGGGTQTTGTLPPVSTGATSSVENASSSFPTGSSFQIGTPQGAVTVDNFYNNADYITEDNTTVVLVENDTYTIVYNRGDSSFVIVLLSITGSDSLQTTRATAESDFLKQLGISQSDACKLAVEEDILDKNSPDSGDQIGLSFCPGAVTPQ